MKGFFELYGAAVLFGLMLGGLHNYVNQRFMSCVYILGFAVLFNVVGCTTMSPEDRAYRDQQITEGYLACRQWYADSGVVWHEEAIKQHDCRRYLKALGYDL
jgi:hypothetical protein